MRLLPVVFCALLICSCSSGKPQYLPPVKAIEPEVVVHPEAAETEAAPNIEAVETIKTYDDKSFLAILLKEGTPTGNIIPRSKEQVAIYKKADRFTFYYFKKNLLVLKKDYSFAEIEQMKAVGNYPDNVLKDLGATE